MKEKIKYIINGAIRRGYWFNNVFFEGCRRMATYNTFNTDVVNLGSTSAVHAFNYDGLGLKCGNWAMSHNPLLGDYAIIQNYSSFLKKEGTVVIITLCPFSALSGSYDYLDDRYYTILYPSTIPNYTYIHDVRVQEKWHKPMFSYPLFGLFIDIWHLVVKKKNKILSEEALQKDADVKMDCWLHEFSIKDFTIPLSLKNRDAIQDAADIINKIVAYCRYKCATPVLVVPPVYHTLAEKFSPEAKAVLFDQILSKIEDENVRFLNYIGDKEFMNERAFFRDSFLLNRKGANAFTQSLLRNLNVIQ